MNLWDAALKSRHFEYLLILAYDDNRVNTDLNGTSTSEIKSINLDLVARKTCLARKY